MNVSCGGMFTHGKKGSFDGRYLADSNEAVPRMFCAPWVKMDIWFETVESSHETEVLLPNPKCSSM